MIYDLAASHCMRIIEPVMARFVGRPVTPDLLREMQDAVWDTVQDDRIMRSLWSNVSREESDEWVARALAQTIEEVPE